MKKGPPGGGPRIDAKDNKRSHKLLSTNIARTSRGIRSSRPEQAIQAAVVQHLAWRGVPNCFWFHPANGGLRTAIEAAIFRGLGVTPGVPDLILVHAGRCYGLELKSDTGRLTPAQRLTHDRLREAGALVATVYGLDEAIAQLTDWRLLRGASS